MLYLLLNYLLEILSMIILLTTRAKAFRVVGLVNKLLSNGVSVLDNIETFDYGKFVHVMDNEGNKIELWEPVDTVITAMERKTTK